jgi:hypothetical protein
MDPKATLHDLLNALKAHDDAPTAETREETRVEALEALEALTEWIAGGGFLPAPVAWRRGR